MLDAQRVGGVEGAVDLHREKADDPAVDAKLEIVLLIVDEVLGEVWKGFRSRHVQRVDYVEHQRQ